jgi:hypothetical protein
MTTYERCVKSLCGRGDSLASLAISEYTLSTDLFRDTPHIRKHGAGACNTPPRSNQFTSQEDANG